MAKLLRGADTARVLTERLKGEAAALSARGVVPTLAILRVGEREDDLSYERGAMKRCEQIGIAVRRFLLPSGVTQEKLLETVDSINADPEIDGCLIFRRCRVTSMTGRCAPGFFPPRMWTALPTDR